MSGLFFLCTCFLGILSLRKKTPFMALEGRACLQLDVTNVLDIQVGEMTVNGES